MSLPSIQRLLQTYEDVAGESSDLLRREKIVQKFPVDPAYTGSGGCLHPQTRVPVGIANVQVPPRLNAEFD